MRLRHLLPPGHSPRPPLGLRATALRHRTAAVSPTPRIVASPGTVKLPKIPTQLSKRKGWAYDPHGWVKVYGNGAVLSGLYISYSLDISASNVTIKNAEVVENGDGSGISLWHTRNVTALTERRGLARSSPVVQLSELKAFYESLDLASYGGKLAVGGVGNEA